ncbi:MAG TPA: ACT domain-containing protein [Acidimicrobiales bacterium]|nr:ACT domain-containing protein [Acidimicrobiales bacterium]
MAALFVVRVWLPDRPGALGAVASRIGAVRGDLVGIEILETGAGRAIDELVVSLPSADLVPLLIKEIREIEDVDVEDIREVDGDLPDARVAALESAAELLAQPSNDAVCKALVEHVVRDFEAEWAAVLRDGALVATNGETPTPEWMTAFVAGSDGTGATASGPDDIAWASLRGSGALVLGRDGRPFRARERRQLAALARIISWRLFS